MVANLSQSPDVVEASTSDLVDVVLHGQLAVQVGPGRQPHTLLQIHRLELIESAVVLNVVRY